MAAVPQKTLIWLWDVLRREYHDPQRVYSDLVQVLAVYPSFAPRTDVYTAENGTPALLVHLNGTIPVNFRGAPYRFPLAIWIPHAYPYESPIVYVTPTDGMVIRPGQHVSGADGRVYHPYLAQWRETWDRSKVVDFLKLLADVFGREPPVMSKPVTPSPQQTLQGQPQPPPRPPPPDNGRQTSNQPNPMIQASRQAPQPPPPPPKEAQQIDGARSISAGPVESPRPNRYDVPLPLPHELQRAQQDPGRPLQQIDQQRFAYQPQRQTSLRQSYTSPTSNAENRYQSPAPPAHQRTPTQFQQGPAAQSQSVQAMTAAPRQYQPQNPAPPQANQQLPSQLGQSQHQPPIPQQYSSHVYGTRQVPRTNPQAQHSFQQPSNLHHHGSSQFLPQHQNQQSQVKSTPKPAPDLMDESPFDLALPKTTNPNLPTPAIPPNPEKAALLSTLSQTILQNLHSQVSQSASALPALESQQSALSAAQHMLQQELAQLHTLQSQLQSNISALNTTLASADRTINSARSDSAANKIASVDEMIIPPTIVARQLYEAVAEQRGYEAAIQALNEGFVRGRIGGEVWSRKCRECSREEFRRKWLVKRIGRGLGLDMSQI